MANESDKNYAIGHGKPPRHTRFQPGRSGNPKGRPRKENSLPEQLKIELQSKLSVTEDGKKLTLTKLQLLVKQLVNKAIKGDVRSIDLISKVLSQNPNTQEDPLGEILGAFRERNRTLRDSDAGERRLAQPSESAL